MWSPPEIGLRLTPLTAQEYKFHCSRFGKSTEGKENQFFILTSPASVGYCLPGGGREVQLGQGA